MDPSDSSQSQAPGASGNDLTQTMQRWRDDILDQPTHEARLHHATCTLAEMTGATRCSIVVPLGRSGLRVLASSELGEVGDLIVARERYPELEYVLTNQASLLIPMTWESELLAPVLPFMRAAGVISLAATPLTAGGVRGVLKLTSRSRSFDDRSMATLQAAAAVLERLTPLEGDGADPSWAQLALLLADSVIDVSADGNIRRVCRTGTSPELGLALETGTALESYFHPSETVRVQALLLDALEGRQLPRSPPIQLNCGGHDSPTVRLSAVRLATVPPIVRIAFQRTSDPVSLSGLDDVPVPLVCIDSDRTILSLNSAARSLTEINGETPVGTSLDDWLTDEEGDGTFWPGRPSAVPVKRVDPGGSEMRIVALIDLRPWERVLEHQRRMRTTLRAQIRELEQLNRRIEEADVIKARFLSSSAHELKTPLTIIQSYLEILVSDLSDGMTEEQISFLRVSYESVLRLKRLVVHLVDIAALESGKLHFEMERVELPALLCELEHEMAALAHSMQIQLTVQLSPSVPPIRADAQRIRQVFRNLIENAIRFTPEGGSVSVQAPDPSTATSRPDSVDVRIADTGVGIPRHQLESVFEEFTQAARPPNGRSLGAGLGLPICKRLIQLQGGSIAVTSEVGVGTTFTVTAPRWPDEP